MLLWALSCLITYVGAVLAFALCGTVAVILIYCLYKLIIGFIMGVYSTKKQKENKDE